MTTTTSLITVAGEILRRLPTVGYLDTADNIGTTYVEHDLRFGNTRLGDDERADLFIWRYNLTGDDRVKMSGYLTTASGRLAQTSINVYSDTSDKAYGLLGVHPDILINSIIRGWAKKSTESFRPLTIVTDGDMETALVANWTGTNATPTKDTGAGNVFTGSQSLKVALSGANGYVRSATFRVQPGTTIYTALRVRADVGTFTFNLYNVTASAVITTGTIPTYTGEDFAIICRQDTVPAGCEEMQIEIKGTGSSDIIYVDSIFGPYTAGRRRFVLPTWYDETWRVELVRPTRYTALPGVTQGYDAYSRDWAGDLIPARPGDGGDYSVENNRSDANPFALQLNMNIDPWSPIELATSRLVSDTETFTGPSSTSVLPKDVLVNYGMVEFLDVLVNQYGWGEMAAELAMYRGRVGIGVVARKAPPRVEQGSRTRLILNA